MEVTGKIKMIGETQSFGSNGFRKREVVVTTEEQYPQHILIEFMQDKVELLDKYKLEDNVTVAFNLRGREWTNPKGEVKYFNTIQGWKINKSAAHSDNQVHAQAPDLSKDESDDLPF